MQLSFLSSAVKLKLIMNGCTFSPVNKMNLQQFVSSALFRHIQVVFCRESGNSHICNWRRRVLGYTGSYEDRHRLSILAAGESLETPDWRIKLSPTPSEVTSKILQISAAIFTQSLLPFDALYRSEQKHRCLPSPNAGVLAACSANIG